MRNFFLAFAVDCKIGSWSEWDLCSVTCGKGTKSRNRQILVAPANGGTPCQATTEASPCNTRYCPSKEEHLFLWKLQIIILFHNQNINLIKNIFFNLFKHPHVNDTATKRKPIPRNRKDSGINNSTKLGEYCNFILPMLGEKLISPSQSIPYILFRKLCNEMLCQSWTPYRLLGTKTGLKIIFSSQFYAHGDNNYH